MSGSSTLWLTSCCLATEYRASAGHSWNQSMVQQFTSDGNMRSRLRKLSPTGENAKVTCTFFLTLLKYALKRFALVGCIPNDWHNARQELEIDSKSSVAYKLGTSPLFKTLLIASTKSSLTICVSQNRKICTLSSTPHFMRHFLTSSLNSTMPYPFATSIWKHSDSFMNADKRVRLWRPLPPTPRRSTLPLGCTRTRQMRAQCSHASRNITRGMLMVLTLL
mmetsp:Transcript_66778/g.204384  ORF Transcript_66778/g.204384 Transcript_66778/m.204384 type:complete len:221 (-) Transcript_66778:696-1358(-)